MIFEAGISLHEKSIAHCGQCGCAVYSGGKVCVDCLGFDESVARLSEKHFGVRYVPIFWQPTSYVLNQNFHEFVEGQMLYQKCDTDLLFAQVDDHYKFVCTFESAAFNRIVSVKQP